MIFKDGTEVIKRPLKNRLERASKINYPVNRNSAVSLFDREIGALSRNVSRTDSGKLAI